METEEGKKHGGKEGGGGIQNLYATNLQSSSVQPPHVFPATNVMITRWSKHAMYHLPRVLRRLAGWIIHSQTISGQVPSQGNGDDAREGDASAESRDSRPRAGSRLFSSLETLRSDVGTGFLLHASAPVEFQSVALTLGGRSPKRAPRPSADVRLSCACTRPKPREYLYVAPTEGAASAQCTSVHFPCTSGLLRTCPKYLSKPMIQETR